MWNVEASYEMLFSYSKMNMFSLRNPRKSQDNISDYIDINEGETGGFTPWDSLLTFLYFHFPALRDWIEKRIPLVIIQLPHQNWTEQSNKTYMFIIYAEQQFACSSVYVWLAEMVLGLLQ